MTLSPAATVSDVDNQTLASATVSISSGFFAGDVLAATTAGTSITASYNAATGVLTLTGTDTLAHYQQVLDSVTYASTSDNPTNFGADTSRTITWVVNDGTLNSSTATTTVSITGGDDAPVLGSVAATASYTEQCRAGDAVAGCDGERRRQPDARLGDGVDQQRVFHRRRAGGDDAAGTSITASYNAATGVLTLTGSDTLAHYQQVLDSVTYSSTSDNPTNFGADTSRTITWVVNDGTLNSSATTTTVSITAVDDAPVLSNVAGTASYPSSSGSDAVADATVTDVDNQTLPSATRVDQQRTSDRRRAGGDDCGTPASRRATMRRPGC